MHLTTISSSRHPMIVGGYKTGSMKMLDIHRLREPIRNSRTVNSAELFTQS